MTRHPKHAGDGRQAGPMTLGNMRKLGPRSVKATCHVCLHSGIVTVDQFPDEFPVPDLARRMWCSKCRSRDVGTQPNWLERKAYGSGHSEIER